MNEELLVSYLYFHLKRKEELVCALLTINQRGFPADFRFSGAKQPNPLQSALYGESLDSYMMEAVITEVLKDFEFQPFCIFCSTRTPLATQFSFPAFFLQKESQSVQLQALNDAAKKQVTEELSSKFTFHLLEPFQRIEDALKLIHKDGTQS